MSRKKFNVLCLDGGGVRGISSLIILRKLLCMVNDEVHHGTPALSGETRKPLLVLDVFDIVVGTSTGGLIALMIVKLGMSVDECIGAFRDLSSEIFSHRHFLGRFGGFGQVKKYCGKHLEEVLTERVIKPRLHSRTQNNARYTMEENSSHEDYDCTVICRELDSNMRPRSKPIHLCSHKCRTRNQRTNVYDEVLVAKAARATSAAPTFFSPVELLGRVLVDGGFGLTNNPSEAAWKHYFLNPRDQHKDKKTHFVNIGTGSDPDKESHTKSFTGLLPSYIQGLISVMSGLKQIAVDTENVATNMHMFEQTSQGSPREMTYDRFSANEGGIRKIGLDQYKRLDEIERLTNDYLKAKAVITQLQKVAAKLAKTYTDRKGNADAQRIIDDQRGRCLRPPDLQSNRKSDVSSSDYSIYAEKQAAASIASQNGLEIHLERRIISVES